MEGENMQKHACISSVVISGPFVMMCTSNNYSYDCLGFIPVQFSLSCEVFTVQGQNMEWVCFSIHQSTVCGPSTDMGAYTVDLCMEKCTQSMFRPFEVRISESECLTSPHINQGPKRKTAHMGVSFLCMWPWHRHRGIYKGRTHTHMCCFSLWSLRFSEWETAWV